MRICTIGGTRFSGRAFTGLALEQGHEVTIFHRGGGRGGGEEVWPDAEHVHGDRDSGLGALSPGSFDAVVDFCAFVPRQVRGRSRSPGTGATSSSHRCPRTLRRSGRAPPRTTTSTPRRSPTRRTSRGRRTGRSRSRPSTRCATRSATPARSCDRTSSSARTTRPTGSPPGCVAPHPVGGSSRLRLRRNRSSGSTRATSRRSCCTCARPTSRARSTSRRRRGATPSRSSSRPRPSQGACRWTSRGATTRSSAEHGLVVTEKEDPFPLVVPDEPNGHLFDTSRAVAAGLAFRPLAETVADTLAWDRDRGGGGAHGRSLA